MDADLERRIQRLEQALWRTRACAVAALLIAVGLVFVAARRSDQVVDLIRAHAIEVVDAAGLTQIRMRVVPASDSPVLKTLPDFRAPLPSIDIGSDASNSVSLVANAYTSRIVLRSTDKREGDRHNRAYLSLDTSLEEAGMDLPRATVRTAATRDEGELRALTCETQVYSEFGKRADGMESIPDLTQYHRKSGICSSFWNRYQLLDKKPGPWAELGVDELLLIPSSDGPVVGLPADATVSTNYGPDLGSPSDWVEMRAEKSRKSENPRTSVELRSRRKFHLDRSESPESDESQRRVMESAIERGGVELIGNHEQPGMMMFFDERGVVTEILPRK